MSRAMNFSAGPAALPLPALERAQAELLDFSGSGMSVMEHSHRGPEYDAVHNEAIGLLRELLALPAGYDVLFLQGGASQHFAQIPMNFLGPGKSADYVVNGAWGEKALSEAKAMAAMYGAGVRVAATTAEGAGKEKQYVRTPSEAEFQCDPDAAYLHLTSNETIHGLQFASFPKAPSPVVVDMSSDFLWRPVDMSQFDFVYAGAQKNIGPSGLVVAIAKRSFVEEGRRDLPKIFQYRTAAENDSLYNTPNTWAIYLCRNVLAWVKETGGLAAMEARNRAKAELLYGAIDRHEGFYRCPVQASDRSVMNVVFRLPSEALEEQFAREAKAQGMVGLKGHRSVGGIRASIYNAAPLEWVQALVSFMDDFARRNG